MDHSPGSNMTNTLLFATEAHMVGVLIRNEWLWLLSRCRFFADSPLSPLQPTPGDLLECCTAGHSPRLVLQVSIYHPACWGGVARMFHPIRGARYSIVRAGHLRPKHCFLQNRDHVENSVSMGLILSGIGFGRAKQGQSQGQSQNQS